MTPVGPLDPRPTHDATAVEVGDDDSGACDELRVLRDRPRQPVDVRRLESGDLAERMAAELAESDLRRPRIQKVRAGRPVVASETGALERPGRVGGARRFAVVLAGPEGRLTGWVGALSPRRGRGVARTERVARVEAAGDGSGGLRRRRPGRPPGGRAPEGGVGPGTTRPRAPGPKRLVGRIDLGHPARGGALGRAVLAHEVGVVLASEATPGGLDRRLAGAWLDPEDGMRFTLRHALSVPAPLSRPLRDTSLTVRGLVRSSVR